MNFSQERSAPIAEWSLNMSHNCNVPGVIPARDMCFLPLHCPLSNEGKSAQRNLWKKNLSKRKSSVALLREDVGRSCSKLFTQGHNVTVYVLLTERCPYWVSKLCVHAQGLELCTCHGKTIFGLFWGLAELHCTCNRSHTHPWRSGYSGYIVGYNK